MNYAEQIAQVLADVANEKGATTTAQEIKVANGVAISGKAKPGK